MHYSYLRKCLFSALNTFLILFGNSFQILSLPKQFNMFIPPPPKKKSYCDVREDQNVQKIGHYFKKN